MDIKNGLSKNEVVSNRKMYGSNEIFQKRKSSFFNLFIESLSDPIIKILLIALGIKLLFLFNESDVFEILGIALSIFVASLISSLSEYSSNKAFDALMDENSGNENKVLRNGKIEIINCEDVVVNDIVMLFEGDKIPADGLVVEGEIYVDESALTGEAQEQLREINTKIFRGCTVTSGKAKMIVKVVGNETHYGKIAQSILEKNPDSPLKERLKHLANFISKIGYFCAFLSAFTYLFNSIVIANDFDWNKIYYFATSLESIIPELLYALTLAVTIIIVAVPEGLPMMITLVLSSNMKRMLKSKVLVKKLVGIETSGSLNILFTDKTGTLTTGNLEVIGFVNTSGELNKKLDLLNLKLRELVKLSLYYNNSSMYENNQIIGGNLTDKAILRYVGELNETYTKKEITNFNSKIKYSCIKLNYNGETYFYKGAFEKIIDKCEFYYDFQGNKKLINKSQINGIINKYLNDGYRIITLATGSSIEMKGLTLLGFIVMKDNIRKESVKGLELVSNAGIQTVMITGDALETAVCVAKELNMLDKNSVILTSDELNNMTDDEVKKIIPNLKIVARSLPSDKNRLVILSQELGLTVGMTGDGVNDAPALKRADVGFAMGSGTEVAKETSDIVILDDNFISISRAILYGRTVFKSIRKFVVFQLTVNFCAVSLSVIGPFIGVVNPVTVVQMLWVNMIMDTLAGIAFSYEPALIEYMNEKPKKRDQKILNSYMINEILIIGLYCFFLCVFFLKSEFILNFFRIDNNNKYVMTAFFGLFIFLAIFNAFNARTQRLNIFANILKNKVFLFIILFISLIQILIIYFGGELFRTTGLTFVEINIMLLLSFSVVFVDFIRKLSLKLFGKLSGF